MVRTSLAILFFLLGAVLTPGTALAAFGDCSQPVSNGAKPTASDCLYILNAAVATVECGCICDTDGSGTSAATDALRCLKVAVGQALELSCACGSTTTIVTTTTTTTTTTTLPGFRIETPEFDVQPGEQSTNCYYFRTPNTQSVAVERWASETRTGTVRMTVFLTVDGNGDPVDRQPPGTLSSAGCGIGGSPLPEWLYTSQAPSAELAFPIDDGTGNPVAAEIPPTSAGFILMQNLNPTGEVIQGGASLDAETLQADTGFTRSAAYVTLNLQFSIPPQVSAHLVSETCAVPADVSFWYFSTQTHSHSIHTAIHDGGSPIFESTDWENPGAQLFPASPFYDFTSNALTYECTYANFTGQTISGGDSFTTDEQCVAITYFFPATRSLWCVGNIGPL